MVAATDYAGLVAKVQEVCNDPRMSGIGLPMVARRAATVPYSPENMQRLQGVVALYQQFVEMNNGDFPGQVSGLISRIFEYLDIYQRINPAFHVTPLYRAALVEGAERIKRGQFFSPYSLVTARNILDDVLHGTQNPWQACNLRIEAIRMFDSIQASYPLTVAN